MLCPSRKKYRKIIYSLLVVGFRQNQWMLLIPMTGTTVWNAILCPGSKNRVGCSVIVATLVLPAVLEGFAKFMVTDLDVGIRGNNRTGCSVIVAVDSWHAEKSFGARSLLCISLGERSRRNVH
jgi:hypothetical protein